MITGTVLQTMGLLLILLIGFLLGHIHGRYYGKDD